VALNPVIKFTTLFGLLATEIAVTMMQNNHGALKVGIGVFFFIIALIFVYRSFYSMRIPEENTGTEDHLVLPHHVSERDAERGERDITKVH
jgi:K(+)-stimulated pyrophosphate-energized sodium pump